jgi:hypothetical protein
MHTSIPGKFAVRLFRRLTNSYVAIVGTWDSTEDLKHYIYQKFPGWEIDQIVATK